MVGPVAIVVILKLSQLFLQIAFVPEKRLIQKFPPDGGGEPLDNEMLPHQEEIFGDESPRAARIEQFGNRDTE